MIRINLAQSVKQEIENLHFNHLKKLTSDKIKYYLSLLEVLESIEQGNTYSQGYLVKLLKNDTNFDGNQTNSLIVAVLNGISPSITNKEYDKLNDKEFVNPSVIKHLVKIKVGLSYLSENLEKLIIGSPEILWFHHDEFNKKFNPDTEKELVAIMKPLLNKIFDYSGWRNIEPGSHDEKGNKLWGAYQLASKLQQDVCPYCNRLYTMTVDKSKNVPGKYTRPEFDHFFSQTGHPELAISLYNLVPSCGVCNSDLKGKKEFIYDEYMHPYENGFGKDAVFVYQAKTYAACMGLSSEFEIDIQNHAFDSVLRKQIDNSMAVFHYKDLYAQHIDRVAEIIRQKWISNDRYLEIGLAEKVINN
jgi:hypothetical protein